MRNLLHDLFVEGDPIAWVCTMTISIVVVGLVAISINGGN